VRPTDTPQSSSGSARAVIEAGAELVWMLLALLPISGADLIEIAHLPDAREQGPGRDNLRGWRPRAGRLMSRGSRRQRSRRSCPGRLRVQAVGVGVGEGGDGAMVAQLGQAAAADRPDAADRNA
jgi:hypothetical protein